jgi:hypothetical protein
MPLGRFREIAPGYAVGKPLPAGWRSVHDLDLLVLCGLTGVGKTSTLAALRPLIGVLAELPERRVLVDEVVARHYGADPAAIDRLERFALTGRFRADHPGGVAAILSQMAVRHDPAGSSLIFDGLRGEAEIGHAARALPRARFAALLAPDSVRLLRLLRRADAFDRAATSAADAEGRRLPAGLVELFGPAEMAALDRRVATGTLTTAELAAKLAIVREERLHYDPDRMLQAFADVDPARWLAVDTTRHDPPGVAALIGGFLRTTPRPA